MSGASTNSGHPLATGDVLNAQQISTLRRKAYSTIEQVLLVGLAPETKAFLADELGVANATDFDQLMARLQAALPRDSNFDPSLAHRDYPLGALPPKGDRSDIQIEAAPQNRDYTQPLLPPAVDLRSQFDAPRSQGDRETCVAFAMTALHEHYRRQTGANPIAELSEQHLYFQCKSIDRYPGWCGTTLAAATQVLQSNGQCRSSVWGYNLKMPCDNNDRMPDGITLKADGLNFTMNGFRNSFIASPTPFKQALANGRPVVFSLRVTESVRKSSAWNGALTCPLEREIANDAHAFCAVGYQDLQDSDHPGYFIVRTSWYPDWPQHPVYGAGYGMVPYEYICADWLLEAVSTDLGSYSSV